MGFIFSLVNVLKGCTTVLVKVFAPVKVLETIRDEKVYMLLAAPTVLQRMSQAPNFETYLSSLRTVVSGGSPLSVELIQTYMRHGIDVREAYGISEVGYVGLSRGSEGASKGLVPLFYNEVRVVDEDGADLARDQIGEILVRGPSLIKGYWNNPEASYEAIKDGWLYTGDMGRIDEDCCIFVVGRKDDMIISGAEHIHPTEVEKLLCSNSKIAEAAVVGQPDKVWGEIVCAVVRPKEGETITSEEVIDFCQGKLARFKIPKRVILRNEPLPYTATAKLLRRTLREQLMASTGNKVP